MTKMIDIMARLGDQLAHFGGDDRSRQVIEEAVKANEWFTPEEVCLAVEAICHQMLDREKLQQWMERYQPVERERKVAIIMAGNLPLVGFFDLLCVLMAGHRAAVKPSSKDSVLMEYVIDLLLTIAPDIPIEGYYDGGHYDMIIATGGDQAARHFRKLYTTQPTLIRGTRHSVALLTGEESEEELRALQRDIFQYSGLGCRNVSLVMLPRGAELRLSPPKMSEMYRGNYLHNRALRELRGERYIDFGECIAVEEQDFSPTLSQINYCYYDSLPQAEEWLKQNDHRLQCVVTRAITHPRAVAFGQAQHPTLMDYADGVDVMEFLTT